MAIPAVQPQAPPQLGILGLQASILDLQASILGLQANILGSQVRNIRPKTGDFGFQRSQLLKQGIYSQQFLGHGDSLAHFPKNG